MGDIVPIRVVPDDDNERPEMVISVIGISVIVAMTVPWWIGLWAIIRWLWK